MNFTTKYECRATTVQDLYYLFLQMVKLLHGSSQKEAFLPEYLKGEVD